MVRSDAGRRIPAFFLYGEAPRPVAGSMLHVETIEARSGRHHWKIDPHTHQVLHQVIFVARGAGVTLLDGVKAQYRPPALILIPAGVVHGFEFEPGTTGHVISMSDRLLRDLVHREPAVAALFARPQIMELQQNELRGTDLALGIRMLAREFPVHGTGHGMALNGWLLVLLGNALRLAQSRVGSTSPAAGQGRLLLERFHALVERRFRSGQKIESYAVAMRVSPSRLRRVCLALTGQSPMQIIHARILLEAKRLLHYTDKAVQTIAAELGFGDAAYFTRFFTRQVGVSPRVFRQGGPEGVAPGDLPGA